MTIAECKLITLPKIPDARGNLTFVEGARHIPFPIKRVFYLYDVPGGESRAGHALKTCHQLIIAISGSFQVALDDGREQQVHTLNRAYVGLHVPPRVWRVLDNFSSGAISLVLASEEYDAGGYFREYQEFVETMRART